MLVPFSSAAPEVMSRPLFRVSLREKAEDADFAMREATGQDKFLGRTQEKPPYRGAKFK
jgi:hypothetical protein